MVAQRSTAPSSGGCVKGPRSGFRRSYFEFFDELSANNRGVWFNANKQRYLADVEAPFLALLAQLSEQLLTIAPHIKCVPTRSGGSMMRIHRDVRFSKDKSPYKIHMGAMLLHSSQKRGPGMLGYVLHLGYDACYLGAGLASPTPDVLARVRSAIVNGGADWRRLRSGLAGEQRTRLPKDVPSGHEFDEDLRRVSFLKTVPFRREDVLAAGSSSRSSGSWRAQRGSRGKGPSTSRSTLRENRADGLGVRFLIGNYASEHGGFEHAQRFFVPVRELIHRSIVHCHLD
jgi:uncharacterized protein (TIGR02453 family)